MFAEEYNPVRVPRLVMFGCEAWVTTRAEFALRTFPETEDPWMFERAFPPPMKKRAFTFPVEYRP
jgi:hypothetical protein